MFSIANWLQLSTMSYIWVKGSLLLVQVVQFPLNFFFCLISPLFKPKLTPRIIIIKMLHRSLGRIFGRSIRQFSVLTEFTAESTGEGFDRRIFISKNGKKISPWHGISLRADSENVFNCVFEIAKEELPKMEVTLDEEFNPIKQDLLKRDGNVRLREYGMPPLFNYGMMPQTWENEKLKDPKYGLFVSQSLRL